MKNWMWMTEEQGTKPLGARPITGDVPFAPGFGHEMHADISATERHLGLWEASG